MGVNYLLLLLLYTIINVHTAHALMHRTISGTSIVQKQTKSAGTVTLQNFFRPAKLIAKDAIRGV